MPRRKKKAESNYGYCPLMGDRCVGPECQLWDDYFERCMITSVLLKLKFSLQSSQEE